MASRVHPSVPYPKAAEPERPLPALTSDLLEEILLRVASPADLARASTACVSFRRLIADHSFLRRYRSIHPPLLLGFVSDFGFHRVQAPHPSAAIARAVARATDFSFDDYLPRPTTEHSWLPCDVRNGRVLLGCHSEEGPAYWDLAVCDPMSRGYLFLPPITHDLLASVGLQKQNRFHTSASFIIPLGGIEEDTSFSVIFSMQSGTKLGVFVFSSVSSCWSVSMSTNRDVLGLNRIDGIVSGQCNDCFYWQVFGMSTLIKFDMNTMQFCTFDLPPGHDTRQFVIVESGESKVAMFSLSNLRTSVDYYTFSQNGSDKSHEWHMMSAIPLPENKIQRLFRGPLEGYIFLEGITIEEDATEYFSIEIKSFKIERVSIAGYTFGGHPYFGSPPSMSPIRIQGYGEVLCILWCRKGLVLIWVGSSLATHCYFGALA